tara:strand:- start:847108 stop:848046 length:939 start_codon:yes stop_codon:yes gene_type:complete
MSNKLLKQLKKLSSGAPQMAHFSGCVLSSYHAIAAKRQSLDTQGRRDEPLIVLIGETHLNPLEYLHHVVLMELLKDHDGGVVSALELDHDYLEKEGMEDYIYNQAPLSYWYDSAEFAFANFEAPEAVYSRKILFNYLAHQRIDQKIKPLFNDASCNAFDEIELQDSATKELVDALGVEDDFISTVLPLGMKIRNHFMVNTLDRFVQRYSPRIALQFAGFKHLAGDNEYRVEDSLTALFNERGAEVLNIDLSPCSNNRVADENIEVSTLLRYEAVGDENVRLIDEHNEQDIGLNETELVASYLDALGLSHFKI